MQSAIHSLKEQKEDHSSRRDALREEVSSVQAQIKHRREGQAAHQRSLDAQARHNIPELRFWEHCLGLRIDGTGVEDVLRFVYVCVDERDPEKECWFDLNMGGKECEIAGSDPKLEAENVEEVQEKLNESRELGGFLKGMRDLLLEAVRA